MPRYREGAENWYYTGERRFVQEVMADVHYTTYTDADTKEKVKIPYFIEMMLEGINMVIYTPELQDNLDLYEEIIKCCALAE